MDLLHDLASRLEERFASAPFAEGEHLLGIGEGLLERDVTKRFSVEKALAEGRKLLDPTSIALAQLRQDGDGGGDGDDPLMHCRKLAHRDVIPQAVFVRPGSAGIRMSERRWEGFDDAEIGVNSEKEEDGGEETSSLLGTPFHRMGTDELRRRLRRRLKTTRKAKSCSLTKFLMAAVILVCVLGGLCAGGYFAYKAFFEEKKIIGGGSGGAGAASLIDGAVAFPTGIVGANVAVPLGAPLHDNHPSAPQSNTSVHGLTAPPAPTTPTIPPTLGLPRDLLHAGTCPLGRLFPPDASVAAPAGTPPAGTIAKRRWALLRTSLQAGTNAHLPRPKEKLPPIKERKFGFDRGGTKLAQTPGPRNS